MLDIHVETTLAAACCDAGCFIHVLAPSCAFSDDGSKKESLEPKENVPTILPLPQSEVSGQTVRYRVLFICGYLQVTAHTTVLFLQPIK